MACCGRTRPSPGRQPPGLGDARARRPPSPLGPAGQALPVDGRAGARPDPPPLRPPGAARPGRRGGRGADRAGPDGARRSRDRGVPGAGLLRRRALPGGQCLVGVRHQVQDEPDPGWLSRPAVRRGLRAVAGAGLAYDLLVLVPQLPEALAAVRDLPEGRFVLDHAAKPPIAAGAIEPWADALAELARLPNVSCKLSGLVTEAGWDDWDAERIRPYADHVLASFGPDRVMFGSDWPVCELAASYAEVRSLADELLEGLSPSERDAVLCTTATRVYFTE